MLFKKIGYYNGLDAVMAYGLKPSKLLEWISLNIGNFYEVEDEVKDELDFYNMEHKVEGDYIVTYDVRNICLETPLDLLQNEDLSNEFVDLWVKVK